MIDHHCLLYKRAPVNRGSLNKGYAMDGTCPSQRVKRVISNWRSIVLILIALLLVVVSRPSSPIIHSSLKVNEYIEHRLNEMKVNQEGNLASRMLVDLMFGNVRGGEINN